LDCASRPVTLAPGPVPAPAGWSPSWAAGLTMVVRSPVRQMATLVPDRRQPTRAESKRPPRVAAARVIGRTQRVDSFDGDGAQEFSATCCFNSVPAICTEMFVMHVMSTWQPWNPNS